ncbi:MAG: hypothetical protein SVY10_04430 [Thermodesulfobacteriota bacterium]|nr:hypothetical protein [Thermodesulfobacteriota bacterium]
MAIFVYFFLEKASSYYFPWAFGMAAYLYSKKHGIPFEKLKKQMAMLAVNNHENGTMNPKAQFRKEITYEHSCAGCRALG